MPETRIDYVLNAAQATGEASKLEASFAGVGKAAQSAGVQGAAGMTQVEAATKMTSQQIAQLQLYYDNMVRASGAASVGAQQLAAELRAQGVALDGTTVATQAETVALEANTVALETNAASAGLTTRQIVQVGVAVDRMTGVIIPGGRAMGTLAASFSAAAIPQLAFIIGISLLIGELVKLARAKEDQIKLDKDQISLDSIRQPQGERQVRVLADTTAAFRILSAHRADYEKQSRQLIEDEKILTTVGAQVQTSYTQGGEAVRSVVRSQADLQDSIAHTNEKLGEQEQAMAPAIATLRQWQEANKKSTEETLAWGVATHQIAETDIPFFRDQLERALPQVNAFSAALARLKEARVDVIGSLQGVQAAAQGVLATFDAARVAGITNWNEQVKVATPALKELDKAIKEETGSVAGYNKQLHDLGPNFVAAIALMKQQQEEIKKAFSPQPQPRDIGPQLEMEALKSSIRIAKEDYEMKRELIVKEFAFRRQQMIENGQDTEANLIRLKTIEINALTELTNEHVAHYQKLAEERAKDLTRQREFREKELKEWGAHYARQRQIREDEEKKFFVEQAKLERIARSDREGRRETQAATIAAQADALKQVREEFGQTSIAAHKFDEMLKNIAEDGQAGFKGVSGAISGLAAELFSVANIANAVGNAIGNAFQSAISGADSFGHSLTKAVLGFIATIAQQFGAMFILIGSGLIWLGWPGGGALIAYGIALEALAGVLRGVADKIGQDKSATASTGGAATASGSTASPPRQGVPPNVINFPTSGKTPNTTVVQLDKAGTKAFLEGQEVMTMGTIRGNHQTSEVRKRVSKWAA